MNIDYSVYLVTCRPLLPPGKDYLESLEESLQGGVTCVQIREKDTETREFLEIATKSKEICRKYNVPIIINDRIDIALAIGADGVHVGQDDMPIELARKLLPEGTVIGVSCNNVEQAKRAIASGADYLGIGSVYATSTKQLTQPIVTVRGVANILSVLEGTNVKSVAIGGIKSSNLPRVLHGAVSPNGRGLDGVAVVSEIVASKTPKDVARRLNDTVHAFSMSRSRELKPFPPHSHPGYFTGCISQALDLVRARNPLIHQITNTVVSTQSANVTLAVGASPIMATAAEEMQDLAGVCDALLVNIGTLNPTAKEGMLQAGISYNIAKKPVILDPVGIGASQYRKDTVAELLNAWAPAVIKGNAGELAALSGSQEVQSKGVDSVGSGFKDPATFVRNLSKKERCVVVLTGPTDYISNGTVVVALSNGHPLMGQITGSGCITGSCIASFCAVLSASDPETKPGLGELVRVDVFVGAIAGIAVLTIAGEIAAARQDVSGPGTFLPALIDELHRLHPEQIASMLKIEIL